MTTQAAVNVTRATGDQGSELASLIARLEQASEPDRDLDQAIFLVLHPGWARKPWKKGARRTCWFDEKGERQWYNDDDREYTRSVDDALTLVPEGWLWTWSGHEATVEKNSGRFLVEGDKEFYGRGHSPAIAICIAALRARP